MRDGYRLGGAASAALENVDLYSVTPSRPKLQAQRSRRGFPAGVFRPEQESQLRAALGRNLQAPQPAETDPLRPGQYGSAPATAQGLLTGPQRLFTAAGAHQQQALQQQAVALECCRVRYPWGVYQDHPLPLAAGVSQRREEQAELAHAGLACHQFSHGAPRPAIAGQLPVQVCVARGQGALPAAGLPAFP